VLIVKKFGGSSVANAERINHVAQTIVNSYKEGNQVVVVLSAQGDTTDELIEKAKEINPNASKREMDMLLSTGEQQSVALMAMAINKLGYPAISLNAFQCNIYSTSTYSNARIKDIATERINNELEKKNIVIITGFQGVNRHLDVTTLGRGGSDTSAVALAAKLGADLCEIYTDVDGVYTSDPRVVKNAKKLDEITYDEMLELASLGAKVLHNRSVELAKKYNVNLVVRSSMTDAEGTIVKEEVKVEKMKDENVASMITLSEESRRMQEMMKMYGMSGMDPSMFGTNATLILNANHPLVEYVVEHKDGENTEMFCHQLYDLAMLAHKPLSPEEMTEFVKRSNEIMMKLAK